jgi:probable HAF family extracellular repeat protein
MRHLAIVLSCVAIVSCGDPPSAPEPQATPRADIGPAPCLSPCATMVAWEVTTLVPFPGAAWAIASDINDNGVVVGSGQTASGDHRGFRYANYVAVGLALGPGDDENAASAINASGHIAGYSYNSPYEAARWTTPSSITMLGRLEYAGETVARDIGASGMVVGYGKVSLRYRAFRWTSANGMQNLSPLINPNMSSFANGVNASNEIVGYEDYPMRAVRWDALGNATPFSGFGGGASKAWDINDAGMIVGWSDWSGSSGRYFTWTSGTGLVSLGVDGDYTMELAISNAGRVAGTTRYQGYDRAFTKLASSVGYTRLPFPSGAYTESRATGVNTCGTVVGWVKSASGRWPAIWRRYTISNGMKAYLCD